MSDSSADESSDGSASATESTQERHWLTNDAMALALVASLIVFMLITAIGFAKLSVIPKDVLYLYVFAVGSSIAWAFGKDAVEAWRGGGEDDE